MWRMLHEFLVPITGVLMSYEFKCPSCGKKLFTYEYRIRKYGSLIKSCKKCGADYLDPRYYEMAISGIPQDELKLPQYFVATAASVFFLLRGIHLLGVHQLGVAREIQWLVPSFLILIGIAGILCSIAEIIMILTGIKARRLDKKYEESRARIKDIRYIERLRSLGYVFPEGFAPPDSFEFR